VKFPHFQLGDLVEISVVGGMVWSAREWWYGHVTLLEAREDHLFGVCLGEIPLIFDLPMGLSVAKPGAGAKSGDFCRGIRDYF
jgi:hypothetical protein